MHLSRFPRLHFAHLPTPLESLPRLSEALGGPHIWVKRDDCTGLSTGGNKTRKLEFLVADALAQGADTLITPGATQSNHARQTAAIAARLDLECHLLLEDLNARQGPDYASNGNMLLDRLHGAQIHRCAADADLDAEMERLVRELRARGRNPYRIPVGGSNEIGALGYVNAALELVAQANDRSLRIDGVVHATGSCGTQAGLVVGLEAMHTKIPVLGICVSRDGATQEEKVYDLARRTGDTLGLGADFISRDCIVANGDYVGEGYGLPTEGMLEAVDWLARYEGILLDPVYSGKGFAGLIDLVRRGHFKAGENVVYVHTGGSAALFAYPNCFGAPG